MEENEVIDLAKHLRLSFWTPVEPRPWEDISAQDQQMWIKVALEAYRWLVG